MQWLRWSDSLLVHPWFAYALSLLEISWISSFYFMWSHVKDLENEVIEVAINVRNLELCEGQVIEQEEKYSYKLQEMSHRYKEVGIFGVIYIECVWTLLCSLIRKSSNFLIKFLGGGHTCSCVCWMYVILFFFPVKWGI